jgi:hypothetical protein
LTSHPRCVRSAAGMFVMHSELCGQINHVWDSTVKKSFAFKSVWFASCSPLKVKGKRR